MNNKFYVSLKVARLLKEKGYNKETIFYYNCTGKLYLGNGHFNHNAYAITFSAPTKAEVIDWLDSKGIVVVADEYYIIHEEDDYHTLCWGYYIRRREDGECICRDNSSNYLTRLEAEDAAIIKALELLK